LPAANSSGHYFVTGGQKGGFCLLRWLMAPAARLAAISADVGLDSRLAAAHARQCQSLVRVLVYQASV